MSTLSLDVPDAGFAAPLRGAQALYRLRIGVAALLWAAAAALLALKFGPALDADLDWSIAAILLFAGILAAGLLVGALRTPSLGRLAALADRRFGLGERLSTAIGLETGTGGWQGLIAGGLRRDATRRAGDVRAARLEPVAGWGAALAALALAAAIAAWWLPSGAPPAPPPAAAIAVDAANRAENLATIAAVIRADAEARQNDYLTAVADAVEKLAQAPDQPLSDTQYREALTGLLDHARLAYGRVLPAWLRGDAASTADPFHLEQDKSFANLASTALGQADDGKAGGGEEMIPETFGERGLLPDRPNQPPAPGFTLAPPDKVGDLSISQQGLGGAAENARSGAAKAAPAGAAPSLDGDAGKVDLSGASGIPLGASSQSSAGASRVAGAGTQAVGDPQRQAAAPIAVDDQVMLRAGEYQQGKRIRIQIAPEVEDGGDAAYGAGRALQQAGASAPVARDAPSVHDQSAFAHYFTHAEAP